VTDDAEKAARWASEGALLKRSKKGRLWILDLSPLGHAFDDSRAAELSDCSELRELTLDDTAISSAGVSQLPEMPQLATLNLRRTLVDDAGLRELLRFPALKLATLTGSRVTRGGVAAIRPVMIGARIVFEGE
jgi:hypothetical protein